MNAERLTGQGLQLLERHFDLPGPAMDLAEQTNPRLYLVQLLTPVVRRMLDQSFDQLLNVLYRIDLPEKRVMEILEQTPPDEVANCLSQAIVDRQLEKISLRERFREAGD